MVGQHHVVVFHQPLEHRLVHDAGIGMIGHVQEFVAGVHDRVNVRYNQSGCIPIIANAPEGGRYLPAVTFRIGRRAAPVAPGQSRLQQGLQVGLNLQHLPDEDNQFRLAELLQVCVRFVHCRERMAHALHRLPVGLFFRLPNAERSHQMSDTTVRAR